MFTGLLVCLQINGCMVRLFNTKFYGDNRPILASGSHSLRWYMSKAQHCHNAVRVALFHQRSSSADC